jgi:hypothetical protein
VDALRAALTRENLERRRAEALAKIQTNVVKFAVDLLVREPDIEGFFRALLKTLAEEGESHKVSVWLIDEDQKGCDVWMAHLDGQVFSPSSSDWKTKITEFPRQTFANHLFSYAPGWRQTIDYSTDDDRMPASLREFFRHEGLSVTLIAPLLVSDKNLGWITLCTREANDCGEGQWWRIALIEAIARQAALALHHSRIVEQKRVEERRKAILEERNRLARDIHDNLAQGFAAILMQLQGAQREACVLPASVARSIETPSIWPGPISPRRGDRSARCVRTSGLVKTSAGRSSGSPSSASARRPYRSTSRWTSCRDSAMASSARSSASRRKPWPTRSAIHARNASLSGPQP